MINHEMRFTTGQFAKMHHVNKRTLHYYDAIGLFSPAFIGENGYRYYTYLQSAALEMLLTMRELNMSISEIEAYLNHRSAESFHQILADKTAEIDDRISQLKEIRRLLNAKEEQLCLCEQVDLDRIEIVSCPREYLVLSQSITGTYDDNDFAVFVQHAHALQDHRLFSKSYGSMISAEKISAGKFEEYDCFFTKVEKSRSNSDRFIKPSGRYLRAFCKGPWDKIPSVYARMLEFAHTRELTLHGYAYEEGLNEMAISSMDEYVTQMMILCQ
ncbi:MAG: MerR family transcriptional regulator [Oscillospiraceae bacterium]